MLEWKTIHGIHAFSCQPALSDMYPSVVYFHVTSLLMFVILTPSLLLCFVFVYQDLSICVLFEVNSMGPAPYALVYTDMF